MINPFLSCFYFAIAIQKSREWERATWKMTALTLFSNLMPLEGLRKQMITQTRMFTSNSTAEGWKLRDQNNPCILCLRSGVCPWAWLNSGNFVYCLSMIEILQRIFSFWQNKFLDVNENCCCCVESCCFSKKLPGNVV